MAKAHLPLAALAWLVSDNQKRIFRFRLRRGRGSVVLLKAMPELTYADRTDSFEEKLRLLEAAWRSKDYRLARSLAHSLRHSAMQAQAEVESPGVPLGPAKPELVESLPAPWRAWAKGWKYCRALHLDETLGLDRPPEPIEVVLGFPADQTASLAREVRVARVEDGTLKEVPCQVHEIGRAHV